MKTTAPTPITVTDGGPVVVIDYPPPALVGQLAIGRREPAGDTGTELALTKQALFGIRRTIPGEVRAVVWAGLLSVVLGALKWSRAPFTLVRDTGTDVNAGVGPIATNDAITDPAVVEFVAKVPRGLVRYADALDPLWLIAQVCLGLPEAKIVVIVRKQKDLRDLQRLMQHHGITCATTGSGVAAELNERVTITLLGQMGMVELSKAHVVLVADPLGYTWEDPLTAEAVADPNGPEAPAGFKPTGLMERLFDAGTATVIGFLPMERRPSPFEWARAWQLFGMRELVLPRPGHVERDVVVARVNAHTAETAKDAIAYVTNKVRMNPQRNRRLAAVARAFQAGDAPTLQRLAPSSSLYTYGNEPRHVLLLAENLKQATALKKHLPGWPLVSGLGDDATIIEDNTITATRGVIATAPGVVALAGDEYDVVVRADSGDGPVPLPPFWFTTARMKAQPVLLVDVEDTGHHLAALWSRRRRQKYRAAGWTFIDEDPDVSAWLRFRELIHKRRARP